MAGEYDKVTAGHYAAYRPPLHVPILQLALADDERFARALDVGCGTGRSTLALQHWSRQVLGTDPSPEMIAATRPRAGVTFALQPGTDIAAGLPRSSFDLVTFAGSLFYLNAATTCARLQPLLAPGAAVIVYDFEVQLAPVFDRLGVTPATGTYQHTRNFSGLADCSLHEQVGRQEVLAFSATATELAHLLFSVRDWRTGPLAKYTFTELVGALPATTSLRAAAYLTRYRA